MNKITSEKIREIWAQMVLDRVKKPRIFYHKPLKKWVKVKDWQTITDIEEKLGTYEQETRLPDREKDKSTWPRGICNPGILL